MIRATVATLAGILVLGAPQPAFATFPGANGDFAFVCYDHDGVLNVCTVGPAGERFRQVATLAAGYRSAPRWSPISSQLLYESETSAVGVVRLPPWRIVSGTAGYGQPAWSPGGDRVALVRASQSSRPQGIYVMRVSGGRRTLIARDSSQPDWSPNGRALAYQSGREIWVHDLRTHRSRRLTRTPPGAASEFPSWAPDGRRVAFSRRRGSGRSLTERLFVIGANGTGERAVIPNPGAGVDESDPAWSPDGRLIAFVRGDQTGYHLAVVRTDGTDAKDIFGPPIVSVFAPDWGRRR